MQKEWKLMETVATSNDPATVKEASDEIMEIVRLTKFNITAESIVKPTLYIAGLSGDEYWTEDKRAANKYNEETAILDVADIRHGSDLGHDYTIQVREAK